MALFVINEWLWADSDGLNGPEAQRQVFDVINALASSDHQIVIVENSEFDRKAYALCRTGDDIVRQIIRIFMMTLRQDSNRCLVVKQEAAAVLPEELEGLVKLDDQYLVRAQLSAPGSTLVTTDRPLLQVVNGAGLPCLSREQFLTQILSRGAI